MRELIDVLTDDDKEAFAGFADGVSIIERAITAGVATSTTLKMAAVNLRAGADLFDELAERMDADE